MEGYDVDYGRRVKREMSFFMNLVYKTFYRIFSNLSYIKIPNDAGDFSLMDKKVVRALHRLPDTDRGRLCAPRAHVWRKHQQLAP